METKQPPLLSPGEVAARLGICMATVYKLIKTKQLPSMRIGPRLRVPLNELEAWISCQITNGGRT